MPRVWTEDQKQALRDKALARSAAKRREDEEPPMLTIPVEDISYEPAERADYATRYQFDLSIPVKRIALADLNSGPWHRWILTRLGEHWPHIGMANFATHARSWIDSNEAQFMRAGRVTALAMRWTEPLTVAPFVREVFLFTENKDNPLWRKEAVRLYREMQIWAGTTGASHVVIGEHSDVTHGRLAETTGADEHVALWLEARRN
jgi:hypothetical protein